MCRFLHHLNLEITLQDPAAARGVTLPGKVAHEPKDLGQVLTDLHKKPGQLRDMLGGDAAQPQQQASGSSAITDILSSPASYAAVRRHACTERRVILHSSTRQRTLATDRPSIMKKAMTRRVRTWVNALLLYIATLAAGTAAESKRVILLHSFGPEVKPWSDYAKAIRAELSRQSPWPLDLHEQSLVTARFSGETVEVRFVEYLRALFTDHRLDLIVSIGAPAAGFVQRYRQQLFSTIPMVLTVVDQRRVQYSDLTANDAVVAVTIDYFRAFENILRVLPDTKTVAVVVGNSPIEKYWKNEIGNEVKPLANRISVTWYTDFSFEELLKHAAALPPQSAIFWELMVVDAAGVRHEEGRALTRLHAIANAPMFSYTDAFFGREIVGGPHVPVLEVGRQTAEVAVRILNGENAGDIKVPPIGFGAPKYDWREMQRWGISESRLPPGSEIHFRDPSAWERYRFEILAISSAFLLLVGVILWLFRERHQRQRSEAEAHALSGRLINAQEDERARLARELHDDVTQRLALLAINAGHAERNLRSTAGGTTIRTMREDLVRLSEDVHALSYRLHPSILEDLGLVEAVTAECEYFSQTCPTRLEPNVSDVPEKLPRDVALCLFRITQEALRNIARHARASEAKVCLRRLNGGLQLIVTDDGAGFDPSPDHARISLGHASMRQRIFLLGGQIHVDSSPGHGTTIRAWVPLRGEGSEPSPGATG
jgi:signal transduction histidine kinase